MSDRRFTAQKGFVRQPRTWSVNYYHKELAMLIAKSNEYTQQISDKIYKWLPSDLVKYHITDYYSLVPRGKTVEDYTNSKPQQARTLYYSF
jgi:hypothetical protein